MRLRQKAMTSMSIMVSTRVNEIHAQKTDNFIPTTVTNKHGFTTRVMTRFAWKYYGSTVPCEQNWALNGSVWTKCPVKFFNRSKIRPVPCEQRLCRSSEKEGESRCLVFTSSTKREIRYFHVVVVQWRETNVQKNVMHVQSCWLANLKLLLICRSRWRRRRRCLSSVLYCFRRERDKVGIVNCRKPSPVKLTTILLPSYTTLRDLPKFT